MAKRRRRRTSIRTAAGTTQKQYLQRLRALRDDPTKVVPEPVGEEPKPLRRIRRRLERMQHKPPTFLDRRDKGVVGAVAQAIPMAEAESVPRILDHKMAGGRKFYTVRGHATRACAIGVQNHDDPRALLLAYREMAKEEGLHFFAVPRLWCSGPQGRPPQEWVDALARKADITLASAPDGWSCPHTDEARLRLTFQDGPSIAVCGRCGKRAGNLHGLVTERYAGPSQRRPVEVDVLLPGGAVAGPESKSVAAYRAKVKEEKALITEAAARWRKKTRATPGDAPRFILGQTDHGADQEAFLDALDPQPWERTALAAMTEEGHSSDAGSVSELLDAIPERLPLGVDAILGSAEGPRFVQEHAREAPRDILRDAHAEAEARKRLADLPDLAPAGPVGRWLHETVRAVRRDGKQSGVRRIQDAIDAGSVGEQHLFAVLSALGGDVATEARIGADARAAGASLADAVKPLLDATGDDYRDALRRYLEDAGTGETV